MRPYLPFLIAITLFLTVDGLISLTPVSRYLDGKVQAALQYELEQLDQEAPRHLDVLCLGSSRTGNAFDSAYFKHYFADRSLNIENMGLPTGDYYVFYLVLNSLIHKYGKPKLILLEASHFLFKDQAVSDNNILYYRALINYNPKIIKPLWRTSLLTTQEKADILFTYLSSLYRYRSIIGAKSLVKNVLFKKPFTQEDLPKNQTPAERLQFLQADADTIAAIHLQGFQRINAAKFERFLQYCHQQQIPVVLVQWPTHPRYEILIRQSSMYGPYYQALQHLARKYHARFIDFSEQGLTVDNALYLDSTHLNAQGARFFTGKLAQFLLESGISTSSDVPALMQQ